MTGPVDHRLGARLALALPTAALVMGTSAAWVALAPREPPAPWSRYLGTPFKPWAAGPGSGYEHYGAAVNRLKQLERDRPTWGEAELRQVAALARSWRSMPPERQAVPYADLTRTEREPLNIAGFVQAMLSDRLALNGPMTPEGHALARQVLLDGLDAPSGMLREGAVAALVNGGLADDPAVLARLKNLRSDPDPRVAAMARLKVAQWTALHASREPRRGTITREDANP